MRSHNINEYKTKDVYTHTHTHTHTYVCMTESISVTLLLKKRKVIQHCKSNLFQLKKIKLEKISHRSIKKHMIFFYYVETCEENLSFLNH